MSRAAGHGSEVAPPPSEVQQRLADFAVGDICRQPLAILRAIEVFMRRLSGQSVTYGSHGQENAGAGGEGVAEKGGPRRPTSDGSSRTNSNRARAACSTGGWEGSPSIVDVMGASRTKVGRAPEGNVP